MPNIKSVIDQHNRRTLNKYNKQPIEHHKTCNCRKKEECPLNGKCLSENLIYKATVESKNKVETYVGLTANTFKTRYQNHKSSFNNERLQHSTELSKHIWSLKEQDIKYNIKWEIICRAQPYTNVTKQCNLCLMEKYFIIFKPDFASLNKRSELVSTCRHARKFMIENG